MLLRCVQIRQMPSPAVPFPLKKFYIHDKIVWYYIKKMFEKEEVF